VDKQTLLMMLYFIKTSEQATKLQQATTSTKVTMCTIINEFISININ